MRKSARRTQQNVADAIGLSVQQISKYELGKDSISASRREQIIEYLELNLQQGFDETQAVYLAPAPNVPSRMELSRIIEDFDSCLDRLRNWLEAMGSNRGR